MICCTILCNVLNELDVKIVSCVAEEIWIYLADTENENLVNRKVNIID